MICGIACRQLLCLQMWYFMCDSECSVNCYYQVDVRDNGLSVTGDMRALMAWARVLSPVAHDNPVAVRVWTALTSA